MRDSFEKYLDDNQWKTLKEHFPEFSQKMEQNITLALKKDNIKEVRRLLKTKGYNFKKENLTLQVELKKELYSGNVVAVDGTYVDADLLTGFQARIGIVSVNYKNNKAEYVTYISEPFIDYTIADVEEQINYLKKKGVGKMGLKSAHIRAIMLFKERDFILKRKEKYKIIHGDILPYEMKTGAGRLRGLNACLDLGRKLLNNKNLIAIQTSTKRPLWRYVGRALRSGEFIEICDYSRLLQIFLDGEEEEGYAGRAHFNEQDRQFFRHFIEDIKNKYMVGLYKVKNRAYVFYAPKENIEEMINLVFLDSKYQPLRGIPLLLDYADIICSKLFAATDFKKIMEMKLAKKGIIDYEIDEKILRRR